MHVISCTNLHVVPSFRRAFYSIYTFKEYSDRSRSEICPRSRLAATGGREPNEILRFLSRAGQSLLQQNESLNGIKDGKVILPAWLGTCTLPQRCSLFTRAAINLHARGYESTARRAESKSQSSLKRNGQGSCSSHQLSRVTGLAGGRLWRFWAAVCLSDVGDS